jgi:molybdate transport system substrate-binding protein
VALSGCKNRSQRGGDSAAKELLLYCGAGIRPPVDELVEAFFSRYGIRVRPDYAGSEVLLSKIKVARRGDLYMPGDRHYAQQAAADGMVLATYPVCYWIPTILVQKGNPKNISSLKDLLRPGVKLGLGDPNACAIGRTSKQIFEKNDISWKQVTDNLEYQSLTVNELGMQIQARSLDAVIVWDAMARYYSEYGDEVVILAEKNIISTVDVGVLKFTKNNGAAEKFAEFLVSEPSREIFTKHGYRTAPPE